MDNQILLNITGKDRPGLTTTFTEILGKYKVRVLDIGQSVIHGHLSLSILIGLENEGDNAGVLKDLLFTGHQLGMKIKFLPVESRKFDDLLQPERNSRYIITLLGKQLDASGFSDITKHLATADLNIDTITRLSEPPARAKKDSFTCFELGVHGPELDTSTMKASFLEISSKYNLDIAFQKDSPFRKSRRLVCFDMDSTLIQTEVIDELAKAAGVGDKVIEITERAMRGEIAFNDSFKERVGLLKGLDESVLAEIASNLPITPGAARLIHNLKTHGYKTALLSGGFNYFGKYLQEKLGIDYVFANELPIRDGKVTGEVVAPIVDGQRKADLLAVLAQQEGISLEQVITVGDGANDLPMLNLAGLGIAFHAKPLVRANAEQSLSTHGLDAILYLLGFRDRDIIDV